MTKLFRNDSPGALTREQAVALEKKRMKERVRQARELAAAGRGEDTEIAHVALGELVVPAALQSPEVLDVLRRAAESQNIPFDRLRVGSRENSINPNTGAVEFASQPYVYDGPPTEGVTVQGSLITDDPSTNSVIESLHPSMRYDAARFINAVKDQTGQ
jgi:hypothetical protein